MQKIVIEPGNENSNYWKDLKNYRGLFYFLAWRDILVRYKQTVIGILWSILRPLLTIIVFTIVFNKLGNFQSGDEVPYALMVCAGMLPWQFFATAFSEASNSLIVNANLMTKVYFPRLIVPASSVIVSFVDFLISLLILAGLFIYYGYMPDWHILLLPVFMLLATITALGAGLFISALNVKYRDFRYIIPFIVQFGLYISPVGFSSSVIYDNPGISGIIKSIYALNPMVGVIDGFRWCLLGGGTQLHMNEFLISIGISLSVLIAGIWYFRRMEKTFADTI
ncbi:MAG: ABC transporter permease [Bacteroidetes bacterium]|nr:MAG: ABC transporter permease [Bacteroidota bacterium]